MVPKAFSSERTGLRSKTTKSFPCSWPQPGNRMDTTVLQKLPETHIHSVHSSSLSSKGSRNFGLMISRD